MDLGNDYMLVREMPSKQKVALKNLEAKLIVELKRAKDADTRKMLENLLSHIKSNISKIELEQVRLTRISAQARL